MSTQRKTWILVSGILLLLSLSVGGLVRVGAEEWRPVDAEVLGTRIESTRHGTLVWSLMVDFSYVVDGSKFYKQGVDAFHDSERAVTEQVRSAWPVGKRFTVFYSARNPQKVSLDPEGEFEAVAIVTVLLIGGLLISLSPFLILCRRQTWQARSGRRPN